MAGCQFSPEVSLREEIAVDYATVVTSQPTHPLDCPHHSPCHSWNLHQFIAEQSSLLYFFCQVDCQGIVVFLFHNILTQHLVHKNSIRLIAYYLFITQIHEKVFDENLVLTLKATFLKFIHSFSQVNGNLTSTFDEKVRLGHFQIQPIKLFDMHQMWLFKVKFHSTGTIGV